MSGRRRWLGVVSDTHGHWDPQLAHAFREAECIAHAGDIGTRDVLDRLAELAPVVAVRGNIDGEPFRDQPLVARFEWAGRSVVMMHIAGSPYRPRRAALALLRDESPDVFLCGHSHIPVAQRVGSTLWVNPGAAGRAGFHTQRYAALLYDEDGTLGMLRVELGPR